MTDKKQTVDLGLLEEDDEFEEFPAEGKLCTFIETNSDVFSQFSSLLLAENTVYRAVLQ